jgi:hypothetical protein
MAVVSIEWVNIEDATRFRQNYRAQSLVIQAQDSVTEFPARLEDQPGTHRIAYSALDTTTLVIRVVDVYQAELTDDNIFDELAIDEIVVIGRPVTPTTNTTVPGDVSTTTTPDSASTTAPDSSSTTEGS